MTTNFQPVTVAYTCSEPSGGADPNLSPVILLHGLTSSRLSWLNIPEIIAEKTRRKVYNLEARNHGDSGSSDVFNYQVLALDVEHFMGIKNITRAIIIGHSLGGKTAMTLALSKPDKIEKMVIEDISPKPAPSHARFSTIEYINYMKESLLLIPPGSDETTARKILADFLISKMSPREISQGFVRHCASTLLIKMTDQGYVWHMNLDGICKEFLAGKSRSPDLKGKFQKDVLFVYGKESSFKIFQDEEFILQLFPKAQFIGIEGATHRVHLDCPEIFAEKVVEFLGVKNPS